uniref:Uncharacterized protein n=1 Tax=viral metagenome TaxID=1070528 RepID=A0A6C0LFZ2_9ZZZZ
MSTEIFYEDLMENFDNKNLREKLMQLVNNHKIIIVKGLSSAQRHTIYSQMYYPLKFEKIVFTENDEENTDIRIYNCKIKKNKENKKDETNEEEIEKKEEYILEDSEQSEQEESASHTEYESDSEDSYLTEEDEQLTRLEDIGSQILERVVKNEKKIDRTRSRVNLVIIMNIISWITLYTLYNISVIHIIRTECEVF